MDKLLNNLGTVDDYIVAVDGPGYYHGQTLRVLASGTNTGAVTITVQGKPKVNITDNAGDALTAGFIKEGQVIEITYSEGAGEFQIVGDGSALTGTVTSETITTIVSLTQAQYDLLTPDESTLYVIIPD